MSGTPHSATLTSALDLARRGIGTFPIVSGTGKAPVIPSAHPDDDNSTCRGECGRLGFSAVEAWSQTPQRRPIVLYVGDHDPVGLRIQANLQEMLRRFVAGASPRPPWRKPTVNRIGVTWRQVKDYDLPGTNPKREYGFDRAVEAEALDPNTLRTVVDEEISLYVDQRRLAVLETVEQEERQLLHKLARRKFAV